MKAEGREVRPRAIHWAEDGAGIWVATTTGPIRFAAESTGWRKIACGIVHRELTAEDRPTFVSDTEPQVAACP